VSQRLLPLALPAWVWTAFAMAGVAITALPRLRWINLYEDQAVLSGQAMQVAAGQVPYRDFFAAIPPGAIFVYAGYYKLVGATVVHQRLLTAVAMVVGAGLVAHVGRRLVGGPWAAAVALLWGVWLPVFQEFSPYHFWSVMFVVAMLAALLAARTARRPVRAFVLAGLAGSAALIMLQSSVPAVLAGVLVAWLIERRSSRSILPMVLALAAPGLLVLAILGLIGALPAFFTDTVTYTFQTFGASQALPFPWQPVLLHDTSFWEASLGALWAIAMHWLLAVAAPVAVGLHTLSALWRGRATLAAIADRTLVGIVAVGLYLSVLVVHMSDQNFWLSACLTLLLVAELVRWALANVSSSRIIGWATAAPVAVVYAGGLSPMILGYALVCHTGDTGFLREVATPTGSICTTFDAAPIVAGTVRFDSSHDGAIAFMPTGPSLYEMTGRVPPVPVLFLVPGVTPPAELVRVEAVMRSLPVEWVVYYKVDFSKDLPAVQAIQGTAVSPFDQFLQDFYQRADQDGLVVYRLKG
jgi:hypothetical protein